MGWFSKKGSQDYGNYLPNEEATLQEEMIPIQASSDDQAEEICKEEAKAYDGFDSKATKIDGKEYDCRFKFWS
ncbi:hypothetical protein [Fortiea contorta]|uniref:hypothetical protein n=1 Tax=Fortiea contorta TaxID=1892405 RepID=UPI00034D118E|nr:hypothetical protein [Fortiea contorta]